ncbi:MAG: type II secretion system F family protein [Parcubacteria group bacterium]
MEFNYEAKDKTGNLLEGIIEAPTQDQAVAVLHRKGFVVVSLVEMEGGLMDKDIGGFLSKPSKRDVVVFTRQLATLIDADIPILEGLKILADQTERASFEKIIEKIAASIEGGSSLSSALAEHDSVFDNFYVNIVKVGEVSGKLQETLLYMADYLERSSALTSKIKGALFYPAFVLLALVVVGGIMMTSVIPQLLSIVEDSGAVDLPITTKILISVTNFINSYLILIIFILVIFIIGMYYYLHTPKGAYKFDSFKINVPKFGNIVRNLYIARMAETLSTLIKSGVPILDGLHITSEVVGNKVYQKILLEAEESVRSGGAISEKLAEHEEFPAMVSSMIATGERTGRVDSMLGNVLKFYETEAEESIKNISQLIEPILILILGVGIGGLISAVLLPIYSLIGS